MRKRGQHWLCMLFPRSGATAYCKGCMPVMICGQPIQGGQCQSSNPGTTSGRRSRTRRSSERQRSYKAHFFPAKSTKLLFGYLLRRWFMVTPRYYPLSLPVTECLLSMVSSSSYLLDLVRILRHSSVPAICRSVLLLGVNFETPTPRTICYHSFAYKYEVEVSIKINWPILNSMQLSAVLEASSVVSTKRENVRSMS